jgi:hypothetical protein
MVLIALVAPPAFVWVVFFFLFSFPWVLLMSGCVVTGVAAGCFSGSEIFSFERSTSRPLHGMTQADRTTIAK